jgi:hypothetical protein
MIDEDIHLEAFAALQTLRFSRDTVDLQSTVVSASQIVAYARRGDVTVDLTVERVLRRSVGPENSMGQRCGRLCGLRPCRLPQPPTG